MIYDFIVKDNKGEDVKLDKYKGKVLLIVNTATRCGFTPQYEALENLYEKYRDKGFEILDFPCNQLKNQAPEDDQAIDNFCSLNYGTKFDRFQKIEVNGENESPLYTYLKKEEGGILVDKIKWNFTKFLVDKDGKVVKRFAPATKPEKIEKDIESLLGK